MELLADACSTEHHEFWPCDLSLVGSAAIDRRRLHGPRHITDSYLLALAVRHGGRLVTFDRSVVRSAVPAATPDQLVVV